MESRFSFSCLEENFTVKSVVNQRKDYVVF